MADMPALSHWPDWSIPFDFANSRVVAYICDRFDIDTDLAVRVFDYARQRKVINFDPITKLWRGTKGGRP